MREMDRINEYERGIIFWEYLLAIASMCCRSGVCRLQFSLFYEY